MTTRKLTAAACAFALGLSGAALAAGCNDRENVESGNQGQKEPIGGQSTTMTSPGLTGSVTGAGDAGDSGY